MSGSLPGSSNSLLDRGHDDPSITIVCEKWQTADRGNDDNEKERIC